MRTSRRRGSMTVARASPRTARHFASNIRSLVHVKNTNPRRAMHTWQPSKNSSAFTIYERTLEYGLRSMQAWTKSWSTETTRRAMSSGRQLLHA